MKVLYLLKAHGPPASDKLIYCNSNLIKVLEYSKKNCEGMNWGIGKIYIDGTLINELTDKDIQIINSFYDNKPP